MADPMTKETAIEWVQRKLGGGVVRLEMTEDHLDDAFTDAIRWYVSRKGVQRRAIVNISQGIQEYAMPDDCDEVIWIAFPGSQMDITAAVSPYAFIDVDMLPVVHQSINGVPGGSYFGQLHQMLAHAETARRVVGAEPAWEYFKDQNMVHVYPQNHQSGTMVACYISTRLNADDPPTGQSVPVNDFRKLRFRDRDMILRYALAQAKILLVRTRGKYTDGMPSAGGSKNMDADTLLGEAQAELEALNTEIMAVSDAVPFLVG